MVKKEKALHSQRPTKPVPSWTEAKLVTIRRHRIEGELSFGVSTIFRQQVLPNYERVWNKLLSKKRTNKRFLIC